MYLKCYLCAVTYITTTVLNPTYTTLIITKLLPSLRLETCSSVKILKAVHFVAFLHNYKIKYFLKLRIYYYYYIIYYIYIVYGVMKTINLAVK